LPKPKEAEAAVAGREVKTFRVTDDAVIVVNGAITEGRQIHTKGSVDESATMVVEGKLCAI
jgi:hypothetical protein